MSAVNQSHQHIPLPFTYPSVSSTIADKADLTVTPTKYSTDSMYATATICSFGSSGTCICISLYILRQHCCNITDYKVLISDIFSLAAPSTTCELPVDESHKYRSILTIVVGTDLTFIQVFVNGSTTFFNHGSEVVPVVVRVNSISNQACFAVSCMYNYYSSTLQKIIVISVGSGADCLFI